jgi:hypothetical protein
MKRLLAFVAPHAVQRSVQGVAFHAERACQAARSEVPLSGVQGQKQRALQTAPAQWQALNAGAAQVRRERSVQQPKLEPA